MRKSCLILHTWSLETDRNGATVTTLLFDYRKAFNVIDHSILVNKLRNLAVPRSIIDHFTVLCSVTTPLNKSEAGVDLAFIQTSLLFLCKSCCCNANELQFTYEKQ